MAISKSYLLSTRVNFFLVATSVFITHSANFSTALATSCQVYPSEYAYRDDSVTRAESTSVNCRRYPPRDVDLGIIYIHCDGEQLKLSDSDRGPNTEYTATSYYVWPAGSDGQLLFIFPTRVSLTTITLHYYSDSVRSLPRLTFYAVPDGFGVWDAPTSSTPHEDVAEVPPGGEPAGRRSVSINVNFDTKKVLMFKSRSSFQFAESDIEFFRCNTPTTTASGITNDSTTVTSKINESTTNPIENPEATNQMTDSKSTDSASNSTNGEFDTANGTPVVTVFIGIGMAILIVLTATAVVVVTLVILYSRKSSQPKPKPDYDDSYSTLCRGDKQQLQLHSQQSPLDTDVYDHIQLSPSTGQSEVVSTTEIENINILSLHQISVSPNTDTDQCNKISEQDNVSTSEQPTHAAVKKIQKRNKHLKGKNFQKNASSLEKNKEEIVLCSHSAIKRETTPISVYSTESLEVLYSVVQKKPKSDRDKEEKVPPPPYSVEELYTAVKKNAKGSAMEEEDGAPQIPPHTIEELYTAVMKKPKGDSIESGTDGAPPIPPHTVDDC